MGRFTFEEKVEYWSLLWGTVIMVATGFALWNPIATARFLPGQWIPAALAAHGGEALLAVLAIVVWHGYGVHLRHFNRSMFTGSLSEAEMRQEHPLELEERRADPTGGEWPRRSNGAGGSGSCPPPRSSPCSSSSGSTSSSPSSRRPSPPSPRRGSAAWGGGSASPWPSSWGWPVRAGPRRSPSTIPGSSGPISRTARASYGTSTPTRTTASCGSRAMTSCPRPPPRWRPWSRRKRGASRPSSTTPPCSSSASRTHAAASSPENEQRLFDLGLTVGMLRFLADVHRGRVDPRDVGFDYDPHRDEGDAFAAAARDPGHGTHDGDPRAARATLPGLRPAPRRSPPLRGPGQGPLPRARPRGQEALPGDAYPGLPALATRLEAFGDLPPGQRLPERYEGVLVDAVERLQERFGLAPDGVLGRETFRALNRSPESLVRARSSSPSSACAGSPTSPARR